MRPAALALVMVLSGCSLALDFGDECTTSAECGGLQCVEGLCVGASSAPVKVLEGQCQKVYGVPLEEATSADTILIGSLFPFTGENGIYGPGEEQAVELAVDEINGSGGLSGKKFAIVSCDDGSDTAKSQAALNHLADLGVRAVIGPDSSSFAIDLYNTVAQKRKLLLVSNSATSLALTSLDDADGLFWRTAPSDAIQGAAIAAYLIEKKFAKVAVVNRNDSYGKGLASAIQQKYCAEGGTCSSDTFRTEQYDAENPGADQAAAILDLKKFEPDVIVLAALSDDGIAFLNLASKEKVLAKPFIASDGVNSTDLLDIADAKIKCGLVGTIAAPPNSANYQLFTTSYYGKWHTDAEAYGANAYDAMYVIAYGFAALGGDPRTATGPALAGALKRLSAGTKVNVGPNQWNTGVQALSVAKDATIDMQGASGTLDFDEHGEPKLADIAAWRVSEDGKSIETLESPIFTSDGQLHTDVLGNRTCP